MNEPDVVFLDAYKRFENLCGDLFACPHGVSEYIRQMEQTPPRKSARIGGWNADCRALKHLRRLRNRIVHDPDADSCTDEDILQLASLHERILNGTDPLAELAALERQTPPRPAGDGTELREPLHSRADAPEPPQRARLWPVFLLAAAALALCLLLLSRAAARPDFRNRPATVCDVQSAFSGGEGRDMRGEKGGCKYTFYCILRKSSGNYKLDIDNFGVL